MASVTIDQLSDATFDTEVIRADMPTVVQFWAPWSNACQRTAPSFEALAEEFEGGVRAARINVDENPQTASNYSVTNLPTFVLFHNGSTVARVTGSASQKILRQLFDDAD
jgi:thioredoxin 1